MTKTLVICGTALLIAGVHFNNSPGLMALGAFMMTLGTIGSVIIYYNP